MTETEQRYAQIEKETLGLVIGFGKFHSYVYGLPTYTAETDHKPLISQKKTTQWHVTQNSAPALALQRYDFKLIYTPGKYIVLAGALSRAPAPSSDMVVSPTTEDAETHINMVTASLPTSDVML